VRDQQGGNPEWQLPAARVSAVIEPACAGNRFDTPSHDDADFFRSCTHMDIDAREYWYYAVGLALAVAVVALA